jgi:flagellar assembly protein FliH
VQKRAREEGFAQGRAEGIERGRAEGRDAVRAECATLVSALRAVADQWEAARAAYLDGVEQEAAELAMAIAERVVGRLAAEDREFVRRAVHRAVALATDRRRIEICVHPRDAAALAQALPELRKRFMEIRDITVVEDPAITAGGALVRTECGSVDARVDTMLEEIRRELYPASEEEPDAGGDRS